MYTEGDVREILEIFYARKTFEIEVFGFCSTKLEIFEIKKISTFRFFTKVKISNYRDF